MDLHFISTDNDNITLLSDIFVRLVPMQCNQKRSFGTGGRMGIMTPAHLDAFSKKDIFPVLVQQSARELIKTKRNWSDVINSAALGCFQNGLVLQMQNLYRV